MFRLIGLAEEAGTGLAKIRRVWREEGYQLPGIDAGTERYEFTLRLKNAHLLADEDRHWLQSLSPDWNTWTEAEQMALILANHSGEVDNLSLREVTGQHPADVTKVLTSLRSRGYFEMIGAGRGSRYRIAPNLAPTTAAATASRKANSQDNAANSIDMDLNSQDNVANSQGNGLNSQDNEDTSHANLTITAPEWQQLEAIARPVASKQRSRVTLQEETIIGLCEHTALSAAEIARLLKRDATYLQQYFLARMIRSGELMYLYPETPNHPGQRYLAPNHGDKDDAE
jgi:ATP-dependent DNA helicase RecG